MSSTKSPHSAISRWFGCLALILCCFFVSVSCSVSPPSLPNPVLSAIGSSIRCKLAERQEYLIFVQYKNRSGRGHFEVDNIGGTNAILAKATFAQSNKAAPLQGFTKQLFFPGEGCTFSLISAIWLEHRTDEQIIIQLKNLPSSLKYAKVLVVPWGQPVAESAGIFKFVASCDLLPGHFIVPSDFKDALITPMDVPRLNRFPILGFTCPIGLKCRKLIKKGETLYPEYFELPVEPHKIRNLVQEAYSYKCWIVPEVVENKGNNQ